MQFHKEKQVKVNDSNKLTISNPHTLGNSESQGDHLDLAIQNTTQLHTHRDKITRIRRDTRDKITPIRRDTNF